MKEYLSTKEMAKIIKLSTRTIERLRLNGKGPKFYKIGKAIRYRRDEVEAWAEQVAATSLSQFW
ncbi:conserved hypothetical protein [Candidatus Terasakiella magnetica]|nr:conserved hypothetical protein [Candidatus Terasakiella magnetica]